MEVVRNKKSEQTEKKEEKNVEEKDINKKYNLKGPILSQNEIDEIVKKYRKK